MNRYKVRLKGDEEWINYPYYCQSEASVVAEEFIDDIYTGISINSDEVKKHIVEVLNTKIEEVKTFRVVASVHCEAFEIKL